MKRVLLLLSLLLLSHNSLHAQASNMGFGVYEPRSDQPCLTEEQRQEIQAQIARSLAQLKLPKRSQQTVLLAWPLQASASLTDYGYHGVSNFVDLNSAFPGQLQDYNCGTRTYDQPTGYNHQGIDYFLWPFTWNKMDESTVEIVATAPGVIIFKQDGQFDRSCGFNNNPWNAVYVQHEDGSIAWYGHMKSNSLTPKRVGERVAVGEYLGVVGSSGNSTGPHLHFELYDASGKLIDPYQGPCNQTTTTSWWLEQRPYYDTAINALITQTAPPQFNACPTPDVTNASISFLPGETVYFVIYYRDQLSAETSRFKITRPDGSIFRQWSHNSDAQHYVASYWYWSYFLPNNALQGVWKFETEYAGVTYAHNFTVGAAAPVISAVRDHATFEEKNYRLAVQALGNPAPQFSLLSAPTGMALNTNTGEITWTPDDEHVGAHNVSVAAANSFGSDSIAFVVAVLPINDAPSAFGLLTPVDNDTLESLREPIRFSWHAANDADNDTLTYTLRITASGGIDTTLRTVNATTLDFDGRFFFKPGRVYVWQVSVSDGDYLIRSTRSFRLHVASTVNVAEGAGELPREYRLYPNHPNPFNPETKITYDLPARAEVSLTIYDLLGQPVKELARGVQSAGKHVAVWNGKNEAAQPVRSGVYIYRLQTGEHTMRRRLLLLQ